MTSVIMGLVKGKPFQVTGEDFAEAQCHIAHLARISGIMFAEYNDAGEVTGWRVPAPADVRLMGVRRY